MTIKHAIPKIEWVIELLYNSVRQESVSWRSDELTHSWRVSGFNIYPKGISPKVNVIALVVY